MLKKMKYNFFTGAIDHIDTAYCADKKGTAVRIAMIQAWRLIQYMYHDNFCRRFTMRIIHIDHSVLAALLSKQKNCISCYKSLS